MRKHCWIIIVALIICTVSLTSCEKVPKMMEPVLPDAEPEKMVEAPEPPIETMPEMVEPPVDPPTVPVVDPPVVVMPVEPTVEPEMPEMPPEMPVETVGVKDGIEGTFVCIEPAQITSPAVGEQLQVNIQIGKAVDVVGYEFKLTFDPEALRYVTSSNADYLPPGAFEAPPAVSENSVVVSAVSLSDAESASSGTLATVTFEVVAAKASTLTLSEAVLASSEATELQPQTVNGEISAP